VVKEGLRRKRLVAEKKGRWLIERCVKKEKKKRVLLTAKDGRLKRNRWFTVS
jgi:hypothetical protein